MQLTYLYLFEQKLEFVQNDENLYCTINTAAKLLGIRPADVANWVAYSLKEDVLSLETESFNFRYLSDRQLAKAFLEIGSLGARIEFIQHGLKIFFDRLTPEPRKEGDYTHPDLASYPERIGQLCQGYKKELLKIFSTAPRLAKSTDISQFAEDYCRHAYSGVLRQVVDIGEELSDEMESGRGTRSPKLFSAREGDHLLNSGL